MSVLIKNMEMPKNCGECQLCHIENFELWCCLTGREDIFYDAIPEWCPLEKPKTGEWIDEDGTYYANCSMCGYQMDTHQERGFFRYCPNCGADMRGGEDK